MSSVASRAFELARAVARASFPSRDAYARAFDRACACACVGWAALLLGEAFFNSTRSRRVVDAIVSACVSALSCAYAIVVVSVACGAGDVDVARASFSSLAGVEALFASSAACCAGWIHYLAFDLYLGHALLARERACGVPTVLRVCVTAPLTFVAGPVGYAWSAAATTAFGTKKTETKKTKTKTR